MIVTVTELDLLRDIEATRDAWHALKERGIKPPHDKAEWSAYMRAIAIYQAYVQDLEEFTQALGGC